MRVCVCVWISYEKISASVLQVICKKYRVMRGGMCLQEDLNVTANPALRERTVLWRLMSVSPIRVLMEDSVMISSMATLVLVCQVWIGHRTSAVVTKYLYC